MAAGEARHGRRDNGLAATTYEVAGDIDPRVGEQLLDVLAADGIAAYLQPDEQATPRIPSQPTERLYVDQSRIDAARDHLDRLAFDEVSEMAAAATAAMQAEGAQPTDIEAEFAKIVAGFHVDAQPDRVLPEPPAKPRTLPSVDAGIVLGNPRLVGPNDPSLLDGLDTFGNGIADDEDRYVPPPPPPMPRLSKYTIAALAGILVGFALFFKPELLPIASTTSSLFGLALLLTGVGTLIARMRPSDDHDTYDPDDGAVV